jgi:hypothetical protein
VSPAPDRQDELLRREDGRYFAIDKFGTGLASVASTERLGRKVVNFGLPSGPALFLHLAHAAFEQVRDIEPRSLFDEHPQGVWPDSQGPLFDFLESTVAHVVFAFTAIEAFANEAVPKGFVYSRVVKGVTEHLRKSDVERRVNLDEKLGRVLPAALSVASPKGERVWQHYVSLKKIRHRLIHLKAVDRAASGPEDETVWGTLLKTHKEPWCDHAHALIGAFGPAVTDRRWYGLYPYRRS